MIIKLLITTVVTASMLMSCQPVDRKEVLIKSTDGEVIEYEGSRKYGNYINAVKNINGIKTFYSIKVAENGDLHHILKYCIEATKESKGTIEFYRDLRFLVTDTSEDNEPDFLGHTINGYYSDTFLINNVIYEKGARTSLTPVHQEEKRLFFLIDSLAKVKDIKYISFDTTKALGWFKYHF